MSCCVPDDPYYVLAAQPTDEEPFDFIAVHAFEMTDTVFKYRCPCRRGFHIHGNGGDPFTNRVEYRSSHCDRSPKAIDLEIHITDKTTRKLRKQKSKRKPKDDSNAED